MACGSSQASGWTETTAASLHHSHSNARSLTHWAEARDQTCNLMDTSWVHYHWVTMGTPKSLIMKSNLSIFFFLLLVFCAQSKTTLSDLSSYSTLMFSFSSFIVLGVIFRSLIRFNFLCMEWGEDLMSFLWLSLCYPNTSCWRDYSFLLDSLGIPVKNHLAIDVWVCFWTLISIPLVSTAYASITWFWFLWLSSKFVIGKCESSEFDFLFQYFLTIWDTLQLQLHVSLRIIFFFISKKKGNQNFDRGCIESVGHFRKYYHINNKSSKPWNQMNFHLFRSSLLFFSAMFYSFQCTCL